MVLLVAEARRPATFYPVLYDARPWPPSRFAAYDAHHRPRRQPQCTCSVRERRCSIPQWPPRKHYSRPAVLRRILARSGELSPRRLHTLPTHTQGRVIHDVFLYIPPAATVPTYLVEHDASPSESQPLLNLLRRYVLRSKVRIRDVTQEWDIWAAWGCDTDTTGQQRSWSWARSGAVEPVWQNASEWPWGIKPGVIHDRRAPGMGRRMIVPKGEKRMCQSWSCLSLWPTSCSTRGGDTRHSRTR